MDINIFSLVISIASLLLLLFLIFKNKTQATSDNSSEQVSEIATKMKDVEQSISFTNKNLDNRINQSEQNLRTEIASVKQEVNTLLQNNRIEMGQSTKHLSDTLLQNTQAFGTQQKQKFDDMILSLETLKKDVGTSLQSNRIEMNSSTKNLSDTLLQNTQAFNNLQKQKFDEMILGLTTLKEEIAKSLENSRVMVEQKLSQLQEGNEKKLEQMRETVDEKLHQALEQRLSESFNQVSERLKEVHEGLGAMQSLAAGVGDLKKVLSNVKSRGTLGEIQLGALLENILAASQYSKNVVTKIGSSSFVEFAIKLPGKDDNEHPVYLPIDSKFPTSSYERLLEAYDIVDPEAIKVAGKELERDVLRCAKDISEKYLDPPNTTDFGIMFLPIEGLYAEVIRRQSLIEDLFRIHKVTVAGPATLVSILNSLQMGFRTLAIEKRSSEVWKVLGAVKTEFQKFGDVLIKAQTKINQANDEIENLVGARTKKIQRTLRSVEEMAEGESSTVLTAGELAAPDDEA